jgi:hypothetical protein
MDESIAALEAPGIRRVETDGLRQLVTKFCNVAQMCQESYLGSLPAESRGRALAALGETLQLSSPALLRGLGLDGTERDPRKSLAVAVTILMGTIEMVVDIWNEEAARAKSLRAARTEGGDNTGAAIPLN